MKVVTELKKKHRNSLWRDEDGDVWFYDHDHNKWKALSHYAPDDDAGAHIADFGTDQPHDLAFRFTRIHKWST